MTDKQELTNRSFISDEQAGLNWWNALTDVERGYWFAAAQTVTPAVAWAFYQLRQARRTGLRPS